MIVVPIPIIVLMFLFIWFPLMVVDVRLTRNTRTG